MVAKRICLSGDVLAETPLSDNSQPTTEFFISTAQRHLQELGRPKLKVKDDGFYLNTTRTTSPCGPHDALRKIQGYAARPTFE